MSVVLPTVTRPIIRRDFGVHGLAVLLLRVLLLFALLLVASCARPATDSDQEAPSPAGGETAEAAASKSSGVAVSKAAAESLERSCVRDFEPGQDLFPRKVKARHAVGFRVAYHGHYATLEIGPEAQPAARYVLVRCGAPTPETAASVEGVVEVPVRHLATTSTTELAQVTALDLEERWIGHADLRFVSSAALRERAGAGLVAEIGGADGLGLDIERLLELSPDLLLVDNPERAGNDRLGLLGRVGTAVVPVPAYRETTPLGRSEWLLVTALFTGREEAALELFGEIERSYQGLRTRVAKEVAVKEVGAEEAGAEEVGAEEVDADEAGAETLDGTGRPSVVTGGPWQGVWHVPGGESFVARLLGDAGADYPWSEVESVGPLGLDVERVFERASDADFWLYPSHWRSLREIVAVDSRLSRFSAFEERRIYAADRRLSEGGGNDYWELGVLRPDLVLADLVSIFHPRLLPGHEPIFHRRLEEDPP